MTLSSQPIDCSITSTDSITIDLSTWNTVANTNGIGTITLTGASYSVGTSGSGGTFTLPDLATEYRVSEEFVNCLPDFTRIQKMCNEYPGLAIAFEKFKTTYKLVKDDYDTPKDKRLKP